MANNFDSNITRKLVMIFLEKFESSKVLCKTVDTQLLDGRFEPSSGDTVDFKRPTDYRAHDTPDGDLTSETKSDIITGKATGTVQNYITVAMEWRNVDEALRMNQLDQLLAPAAERCITELELRLGRFMVANAGLMYGDPDQPLAKWSDVAGPHALMVATGVPMDSPRHYVMNPFNQVSLADTQSGLASGSNNLVDNAWTRAQISRNFGGMQAVTSNALSTRTSGSVSDRAGTLSGNPDGTYLAAKDTMTQVWPVTGFGAGSDTIKAGEVIRVSGRHRLNLSTREVMIGADGSPVEFTATVVNDVTLAGGAGNIVVTGPAINEANGQYNTVDTALQSGDVLTLVGTEDKVYQDNLFYHKQAYGLGTVKLPKLYSTDTIGITQDGFSIRVSKYSDGDANKQMVRFDLLPAFAVFNPFFAGKGWGTV